MDDSQNLKKLEFNTVVWDKIQWSAAYFTIPDFLKKFKFPQIVKVIVGFYGESSESTVSANQVLCLHSSKSIKKIRAHDSNGRGFSISLDRQSKVEVRPSNLKDIYDNVEELCEVFPRYVRISQGYYDASKDEEILNVGDKLKLRSIEKGKSGEKKLICANQNDKLIVLSQDCVAGFQPLVNEKEYYLDEVLKDFSLPLHVRFVEPNIVDKKIQQPFRTVCLDETFSERVITATSIRNDGQHSIVEFSSDTDVCLLVCEETFRKSADYVRICQSLKQYVDHQKDNTKSATDFSKTSCLETIQREGPHSNTSDSNQAKVVKPIVGLPKAKPLPSESLIPKAEPVSAKTIPPRLPARMAKPDPAKTIPPTPPARMTKSCPAKVIPSEPPTLKAKPDFTRGIPPKPPPRQRKPGPAKEIPPKVTPEPQKTKPSTQDLKLKSKISTSTAKGNLRLTQTNNTSLGHSRHQPTIDEVGYAVPTEIFKKPESTEQDNYSECKFVNYSSYAQLNPTYVSTTSHEYAKPNVEPKSILAASATFESSSQTTSGKEQPAKSNPPTQLRRSDKAARPLPQVPVSPLRRKLSEPYSSSSLPTNNMLVLTPEQHEEMYQAIAKYPTDLSKLTVTEVSRLLHNLGMGNYAEMFAAEMVDGDMLSSMNAENLQSLNLSPFHIKKLLKFVGGWRPNV